MNNGSRIQIVIFLITSLLCVNLDAQQYDSYGDYSVGNGASVNRNNINQFSGQSRPERPAANQYPSSSGGSNGGFAGSRLSQIESDSNNNGYTNQNSRGRPGQQAQGSNSWNGARPFQSTGQQNTDYSNNGLTSGSSYQNTGRPTQSSSNREYADSRPSQSTNLDNNLSDNEYSSNLNSISNYNKNSGENTQRRPGQQTSGNSQWGTTRPDQYANRNNGNTINNYQSNQQTTTTRRRPSQQSPVSGVIASNDGFVQPLPDRNANSNPYTSTRRPTQTRPSTTANSGSYYQSQEQTNQRRTTTQAQNYGSTRRPVSNNRDTNYNSNVFNSNTNRGNNNNRQTSQGRPTQQDQFTDSSDEDSSESRPSYSVDRNDGSYNSNKNSNSQTNNNSWENQNSEKTTRKPSFSQSKTTKRPSSVGFVQGNKDTKIKGQAFANDKKKQNNDSSGSSREITSSGGGTKKRVSQIKYEQYLSSIFPDLGNEDVQEITDFHGRKLARPGQFPHMGAIGFRNLILNKTEYKCGASLISDIWVITSAHCTDNNGVKPTFVRFGDLNLKAAEEDIDPQTRRIAKITNHPSYRDDSLYNDIALLLLNKIVVFTEFVQPIRIWYRDEIPFTMAYAMGFGAVQFAGAATNRLTELDLTIVPNDECARQMPKQTNAARGIIDSQICAIDNSRKESDTFQGDSGGPLEISFYGEDGGRQRQYLIGVTSFGVVGATRLPGVYTRVSSYVDWIEQVVWGTA